MKQESPCPKDKGYLIRHLGGHSKIWHRPTLPSANQRTVPSALAGLTSLFSPDSYREGRGGYAGIKQESPCPKDKGL